MSLPTFDPARTLGTVVDGDDAGPAPPIGDRDGGLVLGERLGEGGTSTVDRARQVVLERDVAVKRPTRPRSAQSALLLREAVTTAQIEHPNVIPIHDVRTDADGVPLVVLREVRGRSLERLLADSPPGDAEGYVASPKCCRPSRGRSRPRTAAGTSTAT